MSAAQARWRAVRAALTRFAKRLVAQPATWRSRRADARARAICPSDSWAFAPLYSNGRCPLCGWVPDGYVYRAPLLAPYERYWGALGGIAAMSVLMFIVVLIAYNQA